MRFLAISSEFRLQMAAVTPPKHRESIYGAAARRSRLLDVTCTPSPYLPRDHVNCGRETARRLGCRDGYHFLSSEGSGVSTDAQGTGLSLMVVAATPIY